MDGRLRKSSLSTIENSFMETEIFLLTVSPEGDSSLLWLKSTRLSESISISQIQKINGVVVTNVIVENIDFKSAYSIKKKIAFGAS